MSHYIGYLQFTTEPEANIAINKINTFLGYPNSHILSWDIPHCYHNSELDITNYFVQLRDNFEQCLTPEEWNKRVDDIPTGFISCNEIIN